MARCHYLMVVYRFLIQKYFYALRFFQELLKQLNRIVNELLMSFALRAFDQYCYGYNEYKTKISEIDKKIKQASEKSIIQKLEREKERLKQAFLCQLRACVQGSDKSCEQLVSWTQGKDWWQDTEALLVTWFNGYVKNR